MAKSINAPRPKPSQGKTTITNPRPRPVDPKVHINNPLPPPPAQVPGVS